VKKDAGVATKTRCRWDEKKDMLRCENWECSRYMNKIKTVRREND